MLRDNDLKKKKVDVIAVLASVPEEGHCENTPKPAQVYPINAVCPTKDIAHKYSCLLAYFMASRLPQHYEY